MLTEKQISNLIYYTAGILAMIPLTVMYILTGEGLWGNVLIILLSTLFGLKLTLNDIPHWVQELRTLGSVPASNEKGLDSFFASLEERVKKVDKDLMTRIEQEHSPDESCEVDETIISSSVPSEADLSFLYKKKE